MDLLENWNFLIIKDSTDIGFILIRIELEDVMQWRDIPTINKRLIVIFLVLMLVAVLVCIIAISKHESTSNHSILEDPNANQQMGVSISSEIQLEDENE